MAHARLEVWKFGGASLADAAGLRRAAGLVRGHAGPLVVVASALKGVTDLLLAGAQQAAAGDAQAGARVAARLRDRHKRVIEGLLRPGRERRRLLELLAEAAREYSEIAHAVAART